MRWILRNEKDVKFSTFNWVFFFLLVHLIHDSQKDQINVNEIFLIMSKILQIT